MGDSLNATRPVILTSIPPATDRVQGGEEYQRDCIDSWIASGFRVISSNPSHEVDAVRSLKLPVEVAVAKENDRPTIVSLLELARSTGAHLCGIVNADCLMVPSPGLAQQLDRETTHGLYFTERIDVGAHGEFLPGSCGGFDGFYFLPSEIGTDFDATLRLGDPWWDYWLPCVAALRGIELFRPSSPILMHLAHDRRWGAQTWQQNARYFRTQIIKERSQLASDDRLDELQFPDVAADESQVLALPVYDWLRNRSEALHFCEDQVVRCGALGFRSMRDYHAISAPRAIKKLTNSNKVLESQVEAVRAELASLKRESTRVSRALATLDRPGIKLPLPGSGKSSALQYVFQHVLGADAIGKSLGSQLVTWAGLLRSRSVAAVAALMVISALLFVVPVVAQSPTREFLTFWLAAFGCLAIAGALCATSFALYLTNRMTMLDTALEEARQYLVSLTDHLANRR